MPQYGYTLFSELNGPKELVWQAQAAEDCGFDFAVISDHFHPWIAEHTDSPFAWSVLGAVADRTERLDLATLVTCPFLRYHPAIVAQAAATVQVMSDNRFTLSVGAGERLNEHVVGAGWPTVDVRHAMLRESIEAIRLLWEGEFSTYRGEHVTVEDARIYTPPSVPPDVLVAASGPESQQLAGTHGDGVVAVQPDPGIVSGFRGAGGQGGRALGQIPFGYDRDEAKAREYAMRFKFGVPGWKVMAELPNPVNFDAALSTVRIEDVTAMVPVGPDPEPYVQAVTGFVDAGFEEVCVVPVGDDLDGFFQFWATEVRPRLP